MVRAQKHVDWSYSVSPEDSLPSLNEFEKKLDAVEKLQSSDKQSDSAVAGASFMMRVSAELLAGLAVGGLVGYSLDSLFDTKPVFFVICLLLGVAAGGLNLYKLAMKDINKDSKNLE